MWKNQLPPSLHCTHYAETFRSVSDRSQVSPLSICWPWPREEEAQSNLERGRGENVLGSRSCVEGEHLAHIRSESRGRSRCFRARSQRRRFELESDQVDVKVAPSERGRSWREETAREVPASPLKSKQFDNVNVWVTIHLFKEWYEHLLGWNPK